MGNILLTGANGGIGKATAYELKKREHTVIPVVRADADLSLMSEVNALADRLLAKHDSLDGLLLNAGVATSGSELTSEGFEQSFAVNHLGAFLLAHRLLPLLQKSEQGRIAITGSSDHMAVQQVSIGDIATSATDGTTKAYANSKAVAMAAMLEMARRLLPPDSDAEDEEAEYPPFVRVNVADPGWVRTGLTRNAPLPMKILVTVGFPFQNRKKRSAKVLADLATETMDAGAYTGIKGRLTTSVLLRDADFLRTVYDDTVNLLIESGFADASIFLQDV